MIHERKKYQKNLSQSTDKQSEKIKLICHGSQRLSKQVNSMQRKHKKQVPGKFLSLLEHGKLCWMEL